MNNNNSANAVDDANTYVLIAPNYDANAYNGNGGNRKVLDLSGNPQVIEENHIDQNTRKNYVCTLTDIMVWMVNNMPGKLVDSESPERKNTREMGLLSVTKRKHSFFYKYHCNLLLEKMNRAAKKTPIKLEGSGCLMYNDIVEFMKTKRKILTMNRELAANDVNDGATDALARIEGGADLEARMDVLVRLEDSTYSAIQSAISFLYCQIGIERPAELKGGISLYCKR